MAPKPNKGNPDSLHLFTPSAEELEAARKILAQADESQKKSKREAMMGFIRRNPGFGFKTKQIPKPNILLHFV